MDTVPLISLFPDVFIQGAELPVNDLGFVKPLELSFLFMQGSKCEKLWWAEETNLARSRYCIWA